MAFAHIFSDTRQNGAPDMATLQVTLRTTLNDPSVIAYPPIGDGYLMLKDGSDWSQADVAATQSAILAAPIATPQSLVKAFLDNQPLVDRAIDLTILDQVNLIRSKLPVPLIAITPAQWINAVKAKVDALTP